MIFGLDIMRGDAIQSNKVVLITARGNERFL